MFHSNTEQLLGYWRSLRDGEAMPCRRAFEPSAVFELLPQVLMLDLGPGSLPFRLAGEFLIDLHGKPLRGTDFQDLFLPSGRRIVAQAAFAAITEGEPLVLDTQGSSEDGRNLTMEVLLAPLADETGKPERLLGLYQPTSLVARLAGQPVVAMTAKLAAQAGPHLKLAAVDGRRIA